jgi:3'-5' exoribonuclease
MINQETHIFLVEMLDSLLNRISNPYLSELCDRFVGQNGKYRKEFLIAPAAKSFHHAYKGGLLEHSLEVAEFCLADYDLLKKYRYESLDIDVMLAASLLHDLAKIEEYEISDIEGDRTFYSFTDSGKMIGHLCLSAMWVYSEIENIHNFPHELKEKLIHILLSHHGRIEWGAAILPKTKEADFFHTADHRSATIAKR